VFNIVVLHIIGFNGLVSGTVTVGFRLIKQAGIILTKASGEFWAARVLVPPHHGRSLPAGTHLAALSSLPEPPLSAFTQTVPVSRTDVIVINISNSAYLSTPRSGVLRPRLSTLHFRQYEAQPS
jgi:hypothetical protein